ncbi:MULTISPECIES: YigZ family protein [Ruminococcus]|uniref:YigZ family protein n=1 Tax=Ruminococcus albus 8 TaxID=246199 RepID=E9S7F0_RUMAL|nr:MULTISPECIES: YigZ family protein [Ruminococcus]EGC04791.1 YigZ family protein [Ruminococcus albus 8]MBO5558788.1 YigZ family protein [Ruminococcus sp.]MBR0530402.1 YigZ family protein [Ruminococcus sp.]MCC3349428.1 YigZ family protein [Ruminococcus albus 8]
MSYTTVYEYASDSFTEKKSEFIGHICPVKTAEEAVAFIEHIKSQNRKARHNVYAYVLRDGNASRYSDDGEPQGTGGVPVLDVINKAGLTDVCVVVTRYFGGVLLGASGLVRAYSQACSLAVAAARKMEMCECSRVSFSCDYTLYGRVSYLLPEFGVITEKEDFADTVNLSVLCKSELVEELKRKLTDVSNGQLELSEDTELWADFA